MADAEELLAAVSRRRGSAAASRHSSLRSAVLGAIRKKKSEEQRPLKTPVARAVSAAPAAQLELLPLVEEDLRAAASSSELETVVGDELSVQVELAPAEPVPRERPVKPVPFAPLDPALYREIVRRALAEDLGWGDVTTDATVDPALGARAAMIVAKCDCVIAGLDVAAEAFRQLDPGVAFTVAPARRRPLCRPATSSPTSAARPRRC